MSVTSHWAIYSSFCESIKSIWLLRVSPVRKIKATIVDKLWDGSILKSRNKNYFGSSWPMKRQSDSLLTLWLCYHRMQWTGWGRFASQSSLLITHFLLHWSSAAALWTISRTKTISGTSEKCNLRVCALWFFSQTVWSCHVRPSRKAISHNSTKYGK